MPTYGKLFGPTASVADTLTALAPTTGWQVPPNGPFLCTRLIVSDQGVVEDKENAGFVHIDVSGPEGGRYAVAKGGGRGGATNNHQHPAEQIVVSIPLPSGSIVTVSMLNAEASVDPRICLIYQRGSGTKMMSLAGGGAGADSTAGTELTLAANAKLTGVNLTPTRDGKIREIRWAGAGVIDALAVGQRLKLEIAGEPDMYEFCVGMGGGVGATGETVNADSIQGLDIPVKASQPVVVKLLGKVTTGGAILSNTVSLTVS